MAKLRNRHLLLFALLATGLQALGEAPVDAKSEPSTAAGVADAEDPALEGHDDEAREMEALRAAEEATIADEPRSTADLLRAAARLGAGNALGDRLGEALTDLPPAEAEPPAAAAAESLGEPRGLDLQRLTEGYDIPVVLHPMVATYIRFFMTTGRVHFVKWLGRASRYEPMMRAILAEHGLPKDTVYLAMIESGFSPFAQSWARAVGPWQFIQATGRRFGLKTDFWVDERRDPVKSTHAAAGYLAELHAQFGDWHLAWAGYNAGGGRVARAIAVAGKRSFWDLAQGKVLRRETKHYVPKLIAAAILAKHRKEFGFTDAEIVAQGPIEADEVPVPDAVDLEILANDAGVPVDDVIELNPALRRWCTPPASRRGDPFMLRVPKGTSPKFAEALARLGPKDRLFFRHHVVQRGDTLSRIANLYGSAAEAIMRINGLRDSRRLRLGSDLMVPVPRGNVTAQREARGRLATHSRRRGFVPAPPEQEIPAAPTARPVSALAGSVRTTQEAGRTKVLYGVAQGDTLWAIGRRFGVSAEDLRRWNNLSRRRSSLQIGRELVVWPPAGYDPKAVAVPSTATTLPQPLP